jgi:V8-like Glu-specific endopeptidase
VGSVPTTGPLYIGTSTIHICTASVVSSPTQNLVITAAHCVFGGSGRGMTFVPGSVNGSEPYGRWTVVAAYADPAWIHHHDPLVDIAILKVAPDQIFGASLQVQQVTGGNKLIAAPATIGQVQLPAYAAGVGGWPFSCLATAHRTGRYPTVTCSGGYVLGTSGAPFIQGSNVLGVIGGLQGGGCLPTTEYSSPFNAATIALLNRAASGAAGDTLPAAGSDGC